MKDGVRGYFTNPSRADDCFIPFKSGTTITFIKRASSSSIDIKSDFPDYQNITKDNIFIVPISISVWMGIADNKVGSSASNSSAISYSYNSSTGIISLSGLSVEAVIYGNTRCSAGIDSVDVYVVR